MRWQRLRFDGSAYDGGAVGRRGFWEDALSGGCDFRRLCFREDALSRGFAFVRLVFRKHRFREAAFREAALLMAVLSGRCALMAALSGGCPLLQMPLFQETVSGRSDIVG